MLSKTNVDLIWAWLLLEIGARGDGHYSCCAWMLWEIVLWEVDVAMVRHGCSAEWMLSGIGGCGQKWWRGLSNVLDFVEQGVFMSSP